MARTPQKSPRASAASLNPNTKSLVWSTMSYKWWLMNTCMGGTASLRDAGEALLPKHQGETAPRYTDRLSSAVFTNFVRLTIEFLVGKPFAEKVVFRDGTPPALVDLESDIDGQGNDVTSVCMDFFQKGFAKGWSWLMVEYPEVMDPASTTLADVQANNLRPYWCVIPADNVIADRGTIIEGKWAWTHIRIAESSIETVGFEETVVNRIRMYELINGQVDASLPPQYYVRVTVFKEDKPNSDRWSVETTTDTTAQRIPLVKFMSTPDGDMTLEDLCYLNISHWQSNADQKSALVMARFPILAGAGMDDDKAYVIGPYELLKSSDPQSKFYYVENNGTAMAVGDKDIKNLEDAMAMYGATMLKKMPDRQTATSRIIDETQNMAPLQIMILQFMSAMETVCDFTLTWLGDPAADDGNTYGVNVNMDFALSQENQKQMDFFENARLQGDISREQFLIVAKELGFVPESFNPTLNETQLKAEADEDAARALAVTTATAKAQGKVAPGAPGADPNKPKDKPLAV